MESNRFALAQQLGNLCIARGLRLGLAESCTGGAVSEVITSVPGSSRWFDSALIVYCNESKTSLLDVDPLLFEKHGAVSLAVAEAMATGVIKQRGVDLAIAITGIAGPHGGTAEKPVGMVCFALADRQKGVCETQMQCFYSGRKHIQVSAAAFALQWFLDYISNG